MSNIYIATKFTNTKGFNEMKDLLEKNGHSVILDWTKEDASKVPEGERSDYLRQCACTDAVAVMMCDVLVFIPVPEPMAGAFVELGIAIGRKRVIMVNPFAEGLQKCIFYHLPVVDSGLEIASGFNHVIELLKPALPKEPEVLGNN